MKLHSVLFFGLLSLALGCGREDLEMSAPESLETESAALGTDRPAMAVMFRGVVDDISAALDPRFFDAARGVIEVPGEFTLTRGPQLDTGTAKGDFTQAFFLAGDADLLTLRIFNEDVHPALFDAMTRAHEERFEGVIVRTSPNEFLTCRVTSFFKGGLCYIRRLVLLSAEALTFPPGSLWVSVATANSLKAVLDPIFLPAGGRRIEIPGLFALRDAGDEWGGDLMVPATARFRDLSQIKSPEDVVFELRGNSANPAAFAPAKKLFDAMTRAAQTTQGNVTTRRDSAGRVVCTLENLATSRTATCQVKGLHTLRM